MKRLAVITTHPIQYNAPLFRLIAARNKIEFKVFYTWSQSAAGNIYDPGFGIEKKWDIPLLDGYEYSFVENISAKPGSHHFKGVVNPTLVREITEYDPSAILVYGWSFHSHLKAMRYFKGKIPVYFRGDSTLIDEAPGFHFKKSLRRIFLKWVYRHIDKAFYTGEHNKAYFLKHGLNNDQLIFLPHAVENKRFSPENGTKDYRAELGIPAGSACVLFAGKFEAKKDPLLLLESFSEIDIPGTYLVFVGNGELATELKRKAGRNDKIRFLGFQNQQHMPSVYAMADIFVLPSSGPAETWGLAVNEAIASGKAVLVSDKCGCAPDLVKPGQNGEIFEAGNKLQLKEKLAELLKDKNRLIQMGRMSSAIINDWSFERCASIIENEFRN